MKVKVSKTDPPVVRDLRESVGQAAWSFHNHEPWGPAAVIFDFLSGDQCLGSESLIEVEHHRGVYLPEPDLWLDPHGPRNRAFVSHAHFDHFAKHQHILCSEVSAKLVTTRFRVRRELVQAQPFGKAWEERGFTFRLLPAGHITGSAMIHLTRLSDGATLLYTGDFKTRVGLTAEAAEFLQADTLITETTFGLPHYVFPPEDEIRASILRFVTSSLEDGEIPILLGYSLGKAQEAVAMLEQAGIPCLQHPTVAAMTEACRSAGVALGEPRVFGKSVPEGHALVCPPNAIRSQAVRAIRNRRTAMLTGWAMNANAHYRYLTDAAFPLSDHADHTGLLEAVDRVKPKLVLTLHGSAREFAAELRSRGIEAWSIFGNDQMELPIVREEAATPTKSHARPGCGLRDFSDLCHAVEKSTGRLEKIRLLSAYLHGLSESDLELAASWLSGRAFSRSHSHRHLKVGPAVIRQGLLEASSLPLSRYKAISATQNESARTARILLGEAVLSPTPFSLAAAATLLGSLAISEGSLERASLLAQAFRSLHPAESESLVRIITGGLRIGSKEGLMEDAVAEAFKRSPEKVRQAHMLSGDLGQVALLAKCDQLQSVTLSPMVPVKVMLASPEESSEAIYERLAAKARGQLWLEDKFDGIRAQLHKKGRETAIFSRDLRPLNSEFPELLDELRELNQDFILDGEIIAHAAGKRLTFFDLQKRLGRSKGQSDLFLGADIPVRFVAFDLLCLNGEDLLSTSLEQRRARLETITLSPRIDLIPVTRSDSIRGIDRAFKLAKGRGNEGLIAKDPDSTYSPGRRGKSWLKLKKAMPTLDCVVVKAQQGHGRRAEVLSDYTFALRDESSGELRTIGKAYSGLTDVEIEELTEHFKEHSLGVSRRVHRVEPRIVLEIAFDSINRSKRHDSGLALRFPRIKAIRRDKGIDDIDTLAYAESLVLL